MNGTGVTKESAERAVGPALLALACGLALAACRTPPPDWTPPPAAADVEVSELLRSETQRELASQRARLARLLWGESGLPLERLPSRVRRDVRSEHFAELENLARIDAFEIAMQHGVRSVVYDFRPERPDGRILLYHQGHRGGFDLGRDTIAAFLADGCRVLAFSMPLLGRNSRPEAVLRDGSRVRLEDHDQLFDLGLTKGRHALHYFVEPVVVALNALLREGATEVAMVGISGGGWTTVLAAAVDERIDRSYPVAATLPVHLRTERDWGDLEQTHEDLLAVASFPELYVLGAAGSGRAQLQVYNELDPQVFGGRRHEAFEAAVAERAESLGGAFAVFLDSDNRAHSIGPAAIERLLSDFASASP